MDMDRWRAEIDQLDEQLLRLLSRRAQLAVELARVKRGLGRPVEDPGREQAVLERARQMNPGPLDSLAVAALFTQIIRECRAVAQRAVQGAPAHVVEGNP
jgi:chorismate mutase